MNSTIVSLRQATPSQLQEAAREARLHDSPNQVYGLHKAIFTTPLALSPMQCEVLTSGLRSAGFNYLRITTCARVATEVDRSPEILRSAVLEMVKYVTGKHGDAVTQSEMRAVAGCVYVEVTYDPTVISVAAIGELRRLVLHSGFQRVTKESLRKQVKVGRKTYLALVERYGNTLRLSAEEMT